MTNEQKKEYIAALLREREHYVRYDLPDRLKAVDAELEKVGHKAQAPAKKATKLQPKARTEL